VKEFVTAFNNVRTVIKTETKYDSSSSTSSSSSSSSSTSTNGSLLGNYAVELIQQKLNGLVTSNAPGFQVSDDTYVNLQQLGLSTDVTDGSDTEGLIVLDESTLTSALSNNPDAVADVFACYLKGTTDSTSVLFDSALDTTAANIYEVQVDTNTASSHYQQGRFRVKGETSWSDWEDMTGSSGNYTLTATSGSAKGLELKITYADGHSPDGDTADATVSVKNGIFTQLSFTMEDILGSSGPLKTLTTNYNEIIDNVDKRITEEETRLEEYKTRLEARYARLDTYISKMSSISSYLTALSSGSSTSSSSSG